jgi:hypothetical protein
MGWITDIIKDLPVSAAVKERLVHEEKLHAETKAMIPELQLQVEKLTEKLEAAHAQIAAFQVPGDFTPHDGVLWKKQAAGGYEDTPFCTICKNQMIAMVAGVYYCGEHKRTCTPRKPPK